MFLCNNCGMFFDVPEESGEWFGEDRATYIESMVCPECKSDDLEEKNACRNCGEPADFILCEKCFDELATFDNLKNIIIEEKMYIPEIVTFAFDEEAIVEILLDEVKKLPPRELQMVIDSMKSERSRIETHLAVSEGLI